LAVQVPGVPRLQAWQVGQLAVPQHTPFTQLPMAHSLPVAHARPRGLAAWHFPPLQYGVGATQSASAVQVVLQVAPEQA
jgi:hypothetical protein